MTEALLTFWQALVLTTPFTLGIAVLVVAFCRATLGLGHWIAFGIILVAGNLLGYAAGLEGLVAAFDEMSHPLTLPLLLGAGYLVTYGFQSMLAAAATGMFLGFAWYRIGRAFA